MIFILLLPMRKIEVTSSLWKDVFSSCQKRGTKKKFWVPMKNWTSDLLIVCDCMWNWVKKGVNLVNSKTTSINLVNLRKFECEEQESWRARDQGYIDQSDMSYQNQMFKITQDNGMSWFIIGFGLHKKQVSNNFFVFFK